MKTIVLLLAIGLVLSGCSSSPAPMNTLTATVSYRPGTLAARPDVGASVYLYENLSYLSDPYEYDGAFGLVLTKSKSKPPYSQKAEVDVNGKAVLRQVPNGDHVVLVVSKNKNKTTPYPYYEVTPMRFSSADRDVVVNF